MGTVTSGPKTSGTFEEGTKLDKESIQSISPNDIERKRDRGGEQIIYRPGDNRAPLARGLDSQLVEIAPGRYGIIVQNKGLGKAGFAELPSTFDPNRKNEQDQQDFRNAYITAYNEKAPIKLKDTENLQIGRIVAPQNGIPTVTGIDPKIDKFLALDGDPRRVRLVPTRRDRATLFISQKDASGKEFVGSYDFELSQNGSLLMITKDNAGKPVKLPIEGGGRIDSLDHEGKPSFTAYMAESANKIFVKTDRATPLETFLAGKVK